MTHGLSKSRLQAFRQCPKRLWLTVHRPDGQDVSAETEQRFQIGFQVGDVARSLRPDGVLIDTPDAASGAWREIYHPDTSTERRVELRDTLAEYCQRDTLALVRLAAFLGGPALMVAESGEMAPETNGSPNDESADHRPATKDSE